MPQNNSLVAQKESASSMPGPEEEEVEDLCPLFGKGLGGALILKDESFEFEGIRFIPKLIEFNDAFEGKQFLQKITLQNVGKNPVSVKLGDPSSFIFQLDKHDRSVKLLGAGSSLVRTVSYNYHEDHLVQRSQIPVHVNGRRLDYPIIVRKAVPAIEVDPPELDFGVINMGASAKTLMLTIINSGGRGTKFAVDLGKNELDLVVNPARGIVRAKSRFTVLVEMPGVKEGEFFKEFWVTSSERPIRVPVLAEVWRSRLEVYHPNATGDFTLIDFPPTFAGTQRVETFVLRNLSADVTPFVTLAEIDNELKGFKEGRKLQEPFRMFRLSSEEGRLQPFEARIMTVVFKPVLIEEKKGWKHEKGPGSKSREHEYLVFFRINRVHCIERKEYEKMDAEEAIKRDNDKRQSIMLSVASVLSLASYGSRPREFSQANNMTRSDGLDKLRSLSLCDLDPLQEESDVVRLCLHGQAVQPHLELEPASLDFQRVVLNRTYTKIIKVTNCSVVTVKFKYHNLVNMKVTPKERWLQPSQAVDCTITVTPTFPGRIENEIIIEVFSKSTVVFTSDKPLISLTTFKVPLIFFAEIKPVHLAPKFNLGITPQVQNEVGLLTDNITFGTSYATPRAATLSALRGRSRPGWMLKDSNPEKNVSKAIIAFPNDRPRNFYSWPKDKICRTIFTGQFRYSPPKDPSYAFTNEGQSRRCASYQQWQAFIQFMTQARQPKKPKQYKPCDYDVSCEELFDMLDYKFPSKFLSFTENLKQFRKYFSNDTALPECILVPLSPFYLSNIRVEPKIIDFAMVAPNSIAEETLKVHNSNPFPVSVLFVAGKSGVTLPEGHSRIVPAFEKKALKVRFSTDNLGRYNGFMDYIINGSHQFKITISANVVPKTLIVEEERTSIEFGNFSEDEAFPPKSQFLSLVNPLQSPIKFHWEISTDSAFEIEPLTGEVPPLSSLLNEISFVVQPRKSFITEVNLVSESGVQEPIKLIYRRENKSRVYFLYDNINVGEIPLNLPQKIESVIRNAGFSDVIFEVMDWMPMPGVTVSPTDGVIKARSLIHLEISIQIPVLMKFSFDVNVKVQQGTIIRFRVSGEVSFPMVKIKPIDISLRRISAESFDVIAVCAQNVGKTPAQVHVDFGEYPEYRVSTCKEKATADDEERIFLLSAGQSLKFYIHFSPTDVARYQFYFPVILNGLLGPPSMQEPSSEHPSYYLTPFEHEYNNFGQVSKSKNLTQKVPCAIINCTVAGHLLTFSSKNIKFRPLDNSFSQFQAEEILISNDFLSPVIFCIRTDDLGEKNSPFMLHVTDDDSVEYHSKSIKAQLNPGEGLTLRAEFRPTEPGEFSISLPIFIKGYNSGAVFNYLKLSGELKKPILSVETQEVHFSPLPLGVGCEVVVHVTAENYKSCDTIGYKIWEGAEKHEQKSVDCLTVNWLDEPNITGQSLSQTFAVQVCFQSDHPVSLRTYILFSDSQGEYAACALTAVADNCAVTTHAFLTLKSSKYSLVRELQPALDIQKPTSGHMSKRGTTKKTRFPTHLKRPESETMRKGKSKSVHSTKSAVSVSDFEMSNPVALIEPPPRLIIQQTKSMARLTQLNFCNARVGVDLPKKASNSGGGMFSSSLMSQSTVASPHPTTPANFYETNGITYPNFPSAENQSQYGKHFSETLKFVERWVYQVVLHCDQFLSIPEGFRSTISADISQMKTKCSDFNNKNFVDFLEAIVGSSIRTIFSKKALPGKEVPIHRMEHLYTINHHLLRFLYVQGARLPHVKPEFLLTYQDYQLFLANYPQIESLDHSCDFNMVNPLRRLRSSAASITNLPSEPSTRPKSGVSLSDVWTKNYEENDFDDFGEERSEYGDMVLGLPTEATKLPSETKSYSFKNRALDHGEFNMRATQVWLDVVIQVFRTLVLRKIISKRTLPVMSVIDLGKSLSIETIESIPSSTQNLKKSARMKSTSNLNFEPHDSNVYTTQERVLLSWLNQHFELQRTVLWPGDDGRSAPAPRNVDNFQSHLSDSVVLSVVTASHCPYLVPRYFLDIYANPTTLEQIYHNAIRLTHAWQLVNLGLTVEPKDLVKPNLVFMVILVNHLYENLPSLSPRALILFSTPLTQEMSRSVQLANNSPQKVSYQVRFIGDEKAYFYLSPPADMVHIKPHRVTDIKVVYRARKTQKVTATMILCGAVISPNFAKHLTFQLEGEPSELTDSAWFKLTAPLYKMICMDVPIKPPYENSAEYDIWYSTFKPTIRGINLTAKPWKEIWGKKISRRLFLNQSELVYTNGDDFAPLNVTVACMSMDIRFFWLLFRHASQGDFIVKLEVSPKLKEPENSTATEVEQSESWSPYAECTCVSVERNLRVGATLPTSCSLLTQVKIPARNCALWDTLFAMFQKTLNSQEKTFWAKHFETNVGVRLIRWLLNNENQDPDVKEFLECLQIANKYCLKLDATAEKYIRIPSEIDIPDVRVKDFIFLPLHISNKAPPKLEMTLHMTSQNNVEIRLAKLYLLSPPNLLLEDTLEEESTEFELGDQPV